MSLCLIVTKRERTLLIAHIATQVDYPFSENPTSKALIRRLRRQMSDQLMDFTIGVGLEVAIADSMEDPTRLFQ